MKVSQATNKIKIIRRSYIASSMSIIISIILFLLLLFILYSSPLYINVPWKNFFLNNFKKIYSYKKNMQGLVVILVFIILALIGGISTLLVTKKYNNKYKKQYIDVIRNELELNEIYKIQKRQVEDASDLEFIYKTLNIPNIDKEYLYTFKSMFPLSFYHLFNSKNRINDRSLLIKCRNDKKINGYLQIRFDSKFTIDTYSEKGIFQFNFQNPRKYPYDVYINSSLQRRTYEIVNQNVMKTLMTIRSFTNANLVITITDDLYYVWIPGWELKLTDNLYAHLDGDAIDKKVSVFTELIDEITDLYIYLLSEEELWEEKW